MTFLKLTLSGTVMILAVAAVRALALRRLPKGAFVALWWLTAVRLLVPAALPSRFSVYTLLEAVRLQAAPAVPAVRPYQPSGVVIIPSPPAGASAPAPAPFPIWTVVWLTGAAALALWFLIRYARWRRRFRESLPAEGCPGVDTCLSSRRKVRLRLSDQIAAPLTYGLLRPVILLPETLDLRDEAAVTCVLAHEMSHIRYLDGLFKLVLAAALCVHWFNPAVWLLYVLANRDMELRCDEAAVLALGEDSRERYALALIRLAELQSECAPLCGFSHKSGMEERIKAIMSIKKKSLLACCAALALVLGVTTAFATSAKPREADKPGGEGLTDSELFAQSSAEAAAQWEEVLAPYEPFGLRWTFDDPDLDGNGLAMIWEGLEVRGIYDEQQGVWITEHTGNSTFGPDAVELYTVYERNELTGLRLATEEEQKEFDRSRNLSSDAQKTMALGNSVHYDSGHIYFTIPESDKPWSIFIQGRILIEDGSGMSVHYLEEESEKAEWIPRMTYSFEVGDAAFDELTMDVKYGNATYCYPLTPLLPEGRLLAAEPLPEGKADVPEGVEMVWPVDGGMVSQAYQTRTNPATGETVVHNGVDIAVEQGTPIYAAGKGTVKEAGFNAQDGNFVRIDHGNGQETFYAHCASVLVKTGDTVALGQTIATVGSTGQSTGPHLHFEVLVDGVAQDPERYFDQAPASAGTVGKEGNTDLPAETPEVKLNGKADPAEPAAQQEDPKEPVGLALQRDQLVNGDYPQNSQGETYGNTFGSDLTGHEPDLIAAVGTNGEKGYISMEESQLSWSPDPEEIRAYMNWKEENHVTGYTIPLYDAEHNVIGEFQVGEGGSGSMTFEEMKAAKAQGWPNSKGSTLTEKESIFGSMEEAQEAARNGWVGDSNSGYYIEQ